MKAETCGTCGKPVVRVRAAGAEKEELVELEVVEAGDPVNLAGERVRRMVLFGDRAGAVLGQRGTLGLAVACVGELEGFGALWGRRVHMCGPGVCAVCGCTEDLACPDGCGWVDESKTRCDRCALRIYVASSWRNERQPEIVKLLRVRGFLVYDFRNPEPGNTGFAWSAIDPAWKSWTPEAFRTALGHPVARKGFALDMSALRTADACVLVHPSGRSAHLEAGYAAGAGKPVFVLLADGTEPELMLGMCETLAIGVDELLRAVGLWAAEELSRRTGGAAAAGVDIEELDQGAVDELVGEIRRVSEETTEERPVPTMEDFEARTGYSDADFGGG